jgi:uncharacterized phiE125 gp8 family phage protein
MRSITAIRRTIAPTVAPVSVADMRDHLRITDQSEGAYLESLIEAAVSHMDGEGDLGRAMITQTWAQWVPQSPGDVRLLMGPFQALVSVEYYDAAGTLQTATIGDFETRLSGDFVICRPKENREWPTADGRPDAIKITYTAGFGATPANVPTGIRHALKLLVSHWYENRGIASQDAMNDVPMAYHALVGNERVGWYG